MLQSMTGYGESTYDGGEGYFHVAIKTVNSKLLDVECYLPRPFAHKEGAWRKIVATHLKRGKVFLSLTYQPRTLAPEEIINESLAKTYGTFLKKLSDELGTSGDIVGNTLRLPGVISSDESAESLSKEQLTKATEVVEEAIQQCAHSRKQEGKTLQAQLMQCLTRLHTQAEEVPPLVVAQQNALRAKIEERVTKEELTPQDWEQELTALLNKTAIEEERVRLKSHLQFFRDTLTQGEVIGKKLGFIVQELGRELNTIGAKIQYGPLQHLAVNMKESVEQMREQVANLV